MSDKSNMADCRCALCRREYTVDLRQMETIVPICPSCGNHIVLDVEEDLTVDMYAVDIVALLYLAYVVVTVEPNEPRSTLYSAVSLAVIRQVQVIGTMTRLIGKAPELSIDLRAKFISLGKTSIKINSLELRMLLELAQTCVRHPHYKDMGSWLDMIKKMLEEQLPGVQLSMVEYLEESIEYLANETKDDKTKEKEEDDKKVLKCIMCYTEFSNREVGASKGCPKCKAEYYPLNASNTLELPIKSRYVSRLFEWSLKCCEEIVPHFAPVLEKMLSRFVANHSSKDEEITLEINGDELFMLCVWSEKWVGDKSPKDKEELNKIQGYIKWKAPWISVTAKEGMQKFTDRTNTPITFRSDKGEMINLKPSLKN